MQEADVIFLAVPDLKIADVYEKDVAPHLTKGKTLLFSHGFAIHFKTVVPPQEVDVIMVAPKGPGHIVRRQYVEGKGVPGAHRRVPEPEQAGQEDRPRVGQGHRRHARAASSKRPSRRRPKPISSANRPCSAAARRR